MTDQEIIIEVARLDGCAEMFLIVKRGLYYRPDAHGYTDRESGAWHLPLDEAKKHEYLCGEERVTLKPAPFKAYLTSRDAIVPVVEGCGMKGIRGDCYYFGERLIEELGLSYTVEQPCDVFYLAESIIQATPKQLCIALLKATGKWKE